MHIEQLVLSIAVNQFTVPLPTGKEVINAVNSHAALVAERDMLLHTNDVLRNALKDVEQFITLRQFDGLLYVVRLRSKARSALADNQGGK